MPVWQNLLDAEGDMDGDGASVTYDQNSLGICEFVVHNLTVFFDLIIMCNHSHLTEETLSHANTYPHWFNPNPYLCIDQNILMSNSCSSVWQAVQGLCLY